jgi:hypothetical protein
MLIVQIRFTADLIVFHANRPFCAIAHKRSDIFTLIWPNPAT